MKKILFALLAILLIPFLGYSQTSDDGWDYIGESQGNRKYYIDLGSEIEAIDGTKSFKKAWIKVTEPKLTVKKGKSKVTYYNAYTIFLWEIRCDSKELRSTQFVTYSSKGIVLESGNDYNSYSGVPPGSMGEKILLKLCLTYQSRN